MARVKNSNGTTTSKPARASNSGARTAIAEPKRQQPVTVGEDQVRTRAYELYLQRNGNGNGGSPEEDWYRAEAELRGKSA